MAVDLDARARRAATAGAAAIAERLAGDDTVRMSWVRPRNLHVTVRFLGEVEADVVLQVQREMTRSWPMEPFDLELGPVGCFPAVGAPRVIWIGIGDRSGGLARVAQELDARLARVGLGRPSSPFVPHVTVGRVRRAARRGVAVRQALEAADVESVRWPTHALSLYESRLTDGPPEYVPRASAEWRPAVPGSSEES